MFINILGNSAGGPFHGRHYTAQILELGNQVFLIDCGEGTQMQLFHHRVKFDRCDHIFISHLHGDHVFGLMGLLTNWCLKKRTRPLTLVSPPGLHDLVASTARICGVRFPYEMNFVEVDAEVSAKVLETPQVEVWTVPLAHRTPCAGWLFREKTRPRNIRPDRIEAYQIHFRQIPAIKAGGDLALPDGRVIPNAELTLDPPLPRSYAFCSDTAPSERVAEAVRGVDLLYHEATFTNEYTEEAAISGHSTAAQAAQIAAQAQVKNLILGHISGRFADWEQHLREARAIFPATFVAEEGCRTAVGGTPDFQPLRADSTW